MEKLTHIINPGKEKDDAILYGTGRPDDPALSGNTSQPTGQGSHHPGTSTDPYHAGPGTSTTAGPHSSNLGNRMDPRIDSDRDRSAIGTTSTTTGPYSSDTAHRTDPRTDSDRHESHSKEGHGGLMGLLSGHKSSSKDHDHREHEKKNTSSTTGPHSSAAANKADPRVDSDRDGSHSKGGLMGLLSGHKSGSKDHDHKDHNTTTTSHATGPHSSAAANQMDPRVDSDRDGSHSKGGLMGLISGHRDGETSSKDTHYGDHGRGTTTTLAGPHSSAAANKMDPRVDSDRDGSHSKAGHGGLMGLMSGHHGGQSTDPHAGDVNKPLPHTPATSIGQPGSGASYGNLPDRTVGSSQPYASTEPHGNTGQSHHGGVAGMAGGAVAGAGVAAYLRQHDSNPTDPTHHSTAGGPTSTDRQFPLSEGSATGAPASGAGYPTSTGGYPTSIGHSTAGPHSSNLANRMDPRIDSDRDGSRTVGTTGLGSSTLGTGSTHPTHAGTGGLTGAGLLGDERVPRDTHHHGHSGTGRASSPGHVTQFPSEADAFPEGAPGTDLRSHYHTPHSTRAGALLDPQADSSTATGAGIGSTTGTHAPHLPERSAARAEPDSTGGHASTTAGPHKSNLLNRLDPRVDSDQDGSRTFGSVPGTQGNYDVVGDRSHTTGGTGLAREGQPIVGRETDYSPATGSGAPGTHHHGRDAALAGAALPAGTGILATGKHYPPESSSTSREPGYTSVGAAPVATYADTSVPEHLHRRDGTLASGVGTGGTEERKLRDHEVQASANEPREHHGLLGGILSKDKKKDHPTETHHTTEKESGHGLLGGLLPKKDHHSTETEPTRHGHAGTTAATAGGVGAAALAGHEYRQHQDPTRGTGQAPSQYPYEQDTSATRYPIEHQKEKDSNRQGGLLGLLSHEKEDKDKHHPTHEKEKQKDKEGGHGLLGSLLHSDKKDKHETTHEKEKHKDKDSGHGLLGNLLHKDKDHAAEKEKDSSHRGHHGPTTTADVASTAGYDRHDDHERNRLHKDPPKEYYEKMGIPPPGSNEEKGIVVEPHTGLPMNVGKYGSGTGGTDGANTIPGYHRHE